MWLFYVAPFPMKDLPFDRF